MTIAGAVIVPVDFENAETLRNKLEGIADLEVKGIGPQGIAVVLEGKCTDDLKKISAGIADWQEVSQVDLAYLNWEDAENIRTRMNE